MLFDRYRKAKRLDDSSSQPTVKKTSLAGTLLRKLPHALTKKAWHTERRQDTSATVSLAQPRHSSSLPNITFATVQIANKSLVEPTEEKIPPTQTDLSGLQPNTDDNPRPAATASTPTLLTVANSKGMSDNNFDFAAQFKLLTTSKSLKRHSAEQYLAAAVRLEEHMPSTKRAKAGRNKRHSYTFGHITDGVTRLSVAELPALDLPKRHLPVPNPSLIPQRSLSHQPSPQPKLVLARHHSTSTHVKYSSNTSEGTPLEPDKLVEMLATNQNVTLIDVRNLMDYQKRRIRNSLNVNLPSLLIKRYQRGTVSNFNLVNFITTAEGRERYAHRDTPPASASTTNPSSSILEQKATEAAAKKRNSRGDKLSLPVWVVYDEDMDPQQTSQAWTLLSVLDRAMTGKTYYLAGGFKAFEEHSQYLVEGAEDDCNDATDKQTPLPRRSLSYTMGTLHTDTSSLNRRTSLFSLDTQAARVNNANALARRANRRTQATGAGKAERMTPVKDSFILPQSSQSQPLLSHADQGLPMLARVMEDDETAIFTNCSPVTESDFDFVISEIIPGFLFVGPEIENIEQAEQLEARQIRRILNMAEECNDDVEGLHEKMLYRKIAARDTVEMKNIDWVMMEAVCFIGNFLEFSLHIGISYLILYLYIEDAKRNHEPIYVHCKAGKSRSVTAILAYLVASERWTLKQAYRHVIKARPNISPNIGFIAELMKMEGRVHGRVSSFMETDWQSSAMPSPEFSRTLKQLEYSWQQSPQETGISATAAALK
ncbi:hypothetical protein DFQ28_009517 [Apophysomyces sp. BC1034]|nr:hypothetical protein DFQ30_009199 [Apophysomyces sp. BC1015]KAG0181654.1 hypothetical protein DFQ29_007640 [Apophysomyces sp. BC1021]KAG0192291.1 hypothetical protein DFQ28_009517 [Apophysomyces sp. BC1034]